MTGAGQYRAFGWHSTQTKRDRSNGLVSMWAAVVTAECGDEREDPERRPTVNPGGRTAAEP